MGPGQGGGGASFGSKDLLREPKRPPKKVSGPTLGSSNVFGVMEVYIYIYIGAPKGDGPKRE